MDAGERKRERERLRMDMDGHRETNRIPFKRVVVVVVSNTWRGRGPEEGVPEREPRAGDEALQEGVGQRGVPVVFRGLVSVAFVWGGVSFAWLGLVLIVHFFPFLFSIDAIDVCACITGEVHLPAALPPCLALKGLQPATRFAICIISMHVTTAASALHRSVKTKSSPDATLFLLAD